MAEMTSVQPALLNDIANFVSGDISYVLLNDKIKLTEFKQKQVSDNVISIEYTVTPEMTGLITNIKLMRSDNTVLTQSIVYVPVSQPVISKHIIPIKEGV